MPHVDLDGSNAQDGFQGQWQLEVKHAEIGVQKGS